MDGKIPFTELEPKAMFNEGMRDQIRKQIKAIAPNVAAETAKQATMHQIPNTIRRWTWPLVGAGLLGNAISQNIWSASTIKNALQGRLGE